MLLQILQHFLFGASLHTHYLQKKLHFNIKIICGLDVVQDLQKIILKHLAFFVPDFKLAIEPDFFGQGEFTHFV